MKPINEYTLQDCLDAIRRDDYLDRHDIADRIHELTSVMIELILVAENLVVNPSTNISSSTDFACDTWHKRLAHWKHIDKREGS